MGDAGPPTPLPNDLPPRDIHVLVTGFGPFKSFTINPSWLIASSLPPTLDALPTPPGHALHSFINRSQQQPLRTPNLTPYRIVLHVYPSPIKVAYSTISSTVSSLLDPTNPESYDFVLHIGLASGRDSYTLETLAHRKDYIIPDVDECDGFLAGTEKWIAEGVPESLSVGWEAQDVLRRWERDVDESWDEYSKRAQPETGLRSWVAAHALLRQDRRPVVKLSKDAGRYACEFILMSSLAVRWRDSKAEQVGKVAFLHVPNGINTSDVQKGVVVAEAAIRSLVASWEAGWRNPAVYAGGESVVDGVGFESKGTGDSV